jgi:hypothetical protein
MVANNVMYGYIYDADTRTCNLNIIERVKGGNISGRWWTKQPWNAKVSFVNDEWVFQQSFSSKEEGVIIKNSNIFNLIDEVIETLGF